MLCFSLQWLLCLCFILLASVSFQIHTQQSKWHFSAQSARPHSWPNGPHGRGVSKFVNYFHKLLKDTALAVLSQDKWLYWSLPSSCDDPSGYPVHWFCMFAHPDHWSCIFSTTSLHSTLIIWFPGSLWFLLFQNSHPWPSFCISSDLEWERMCLSKIFPNNISLEIKKFCDMLSC